MSNTKSNFKIGYPIIGVNAAKSLTNIEKNTVIGSNALLTATSNYCNTAIGYETLKSNTSGDYNTAIGTFTLQNNTTGIYNTAVGYSSLQNNTTATRNTVIGFRAGIAITTSSSNTLIGTLTDLSNNDKTQQIAIGQLAIPNDSNYSVQLGQAINGSSGVFRYRSQIVSQESWIDTNSRFAEIDGNGNLVKSSVAPFSLTLQNTGTNTALLIPSPISSGTASFKTIAVGTGLSISDNGTTVIISNTAPENFLTLENSGSNVVGTKIMVANAPVDSGVAKIKTLLSGSSISLVDDGSTITINSTVAALTLQNSGTNTALLVPSPISSGTAKFKTLAVGTGLSISDNGTTVIISNTAPENFLTLVNSGSNVVGTKLIVANAPINSGNARIKSLLSGSSISLVDNGSTITINSTVAALTLQNTGTGAITILNNSPISSGTANFKTIVNGLNMNLLTNGSSLTIGTNTNVITGINTTSNTAIGNTSLPSLTSGTSNTAFGVNTLNAITTQQNNTAVGFEALKAGASNDNTAFGYKAMTSMTTGSVNIAIGLNAMDTATTAIQNIAIGQGSLQSNEGTYNIGIGRNTLSVGTFGSNVAIGVDSGQFMTTGYNNVAIGTNSARSMTTGYQNVALGYSSMVNASGYNYKNIAIGQESLYTMNDGYQNIAIGVKSLYLANANTLTYNIGLGNESLYNFTLGQHNIGIGFKSGSTLTAGDQNILMGSYANTSAYNSAGQIVIGYSAVPNNTNYSVQLGQATNTGSGVMKFRSQIISQETWNDTNTRFAEIDGNGNFVKSSIAPFSLTLQNTGTNTTLLIPSPISSGTASFKTIAVGTGLSISDNGTTVIISNTAPENFLTLVNSGSNVVGTKLIVANAPVDSGNARIKTLLSGSSISLVDDGSTITINSTVAALTLQNTGTSNIGLLVPSPISSGTASFKTLAGSSGITLSDNGTTVTVSNTAPYYFSVAGGNAASPSLVNSINFISTTGTGAATGTLTTGNYDGQLLHLVAASIGAGTSYDLTTTGVLTAANGAAVSLMSFTSSGESAMLIYNQTLSMWFIANSGTTLS